MGADQDEMEKFQLDVSVVDPISYSSPYRPSHTSFCIRIKTNHPAFSLPSSEVRRRYSEFKWLRNVIQRYHPESTVPALPSVGFLTWNRFTPEFLERRRLGLQSFINSIIDVPVYLGEKALHLFMQTELSTKEIELNLLGKRDDEVEKLQCVPTVISSLPLDIECSRSHDTCFAEDALTLLLDDGYCSADKVGVTFLSSDGSEVEEIAVNGSPWYSTASAVPEECQPAMVI